MGGTLRSVLASLCLLAALAAVLGAPITGEAATSGVIEGSLHNATTGAPIGGARVKLYWAKGQEPQPERTATTGADGRYRFDRLLTGDDYGYVVYTVFQGVEYTSERTALTNAKPTATIPLRAYASTNDDSAIRVKQVSTVVLDVNKESQAMFALQTYVFDNPTKRTFRPVVDGPRGPMGLLRFSLPPNANQLSAMGELSSREVIQTDRGFGTDLPLRPGQTEVSFTYQVPYRDPSGVLTFEMTMPYPTGEFRLMTPQKQARFTSPNLTADKPQKLFRNPGDTFDVMLASDLPARTKLKISASNLPVNIHPLRVGNPVLWGGSAGLLMLLVTAAYVLWRRSPEKEADANTTTEEREELVAALAVLEEQHELGAVDERTYQRERDLRRQRLLALLATSPEAG